MLEITINETVYKFKFGLGFIRDLDKKISVKVRDGINEDIGLNYIMAKVMNGDAVALVEVLDTANKYAGDPRITKKQLEDYIEDENTDIDELFQNTIDFFGKSNATKKLAENLMQELKKEQEAQ